MKESVKKACQEFEDMLLHNTKYSGNSEPNKKIFSASMLGSDMLQNFYKFKYGSSDNTQFEANTFGSIYQLGVDLAVDNYQISKIVGPSNKLKYQSAVRLTFELDNGWTISGEMDQIDWDSKVIFDNKVTTEKTIDSIKKDGKNHQYALQLAVYRFLIDKNIEKANTYSGVLAVVDKGFSYFKNNKYNQLTFIEPELYSIDEIEKILYEKTNQLQEFIDLDEEPAKCLNLFPYRPKGSKITKNMKCLHYCDYASHCKYFSYHDKNNTIANILDL